MNEGEGAGRHRTLADSFGTFAASVPRMPAPLRPLCLVSSAIDVPLDQPRQWSDIRVPRPGGLVEVTVETSSDCQLTPCRQVPGWLRQDRGMVVRTPVGDQLDGEQEQSRHNPAWASEFATRGPFPGAPAHDEDYLPIRNPMANVAISTRRPRRIAHDDTTVSLLRSFSHERDRDLQRPVA